MIHDVPQCNPKISLSQTANSSANQMQCIKETGLLTGYAAANYPLT